MGEEEALIRAILARPGDDSLRLVYADWLEERGDARAGYVRLLCRLSGDSPPPAEERGPLLARLEEMRAGLDPQWVGLMHRGRALVAAPDAPGDRLAESPEPWVVRAARRKKRPFNEAEVSHFLQQYGRRGCNDRPYSREVEERVKRMKPEDLDRLMRGEEG